MLRADTPPREGAIRQKPLGYNLGDDGLHPAFYFEPGGKEYYKYWGRKGIKLADLVLRKLSQNERLDDPILLPAKHQKVSAFDEDGNWLGIQGPKELLLDEDDPVVDSFLRVIGAGDMDVLRGMTTHDSLDGVVFRTIVEEHRDATKLSNSHKERLTAGVPLPAITVDFIRTS